MTQGRLIAIDVAFLVLLLAFVQLAAALAGPWALALEGVASLALVSAALLLLRTGGAGRSLAHRLISRMALVPAFLAACLVASRSIEAWLVVGSLLLTICLIVVGSRLLEQQVFSPDSG